MPIRLMPDGCRWAFFQIRTVPPESDGLSPVGDPNAAISSSWGLPCQVLSRVSSGTGGAGAHPAMTRSRDRRNGTRFFILLPTQIFSHCREKEKGPDTFSQSQE